MFILKYILIYILTFISFLLIDMLWLGVIAKKTYDTYLSALRAPTVNWPPAIIFYLLFVFSIFIFVINPAIQKNSLLSALTYGSLFGLVTYATYELTNYAVIKNWPAKLVYIDIVWGMILTAIVSVVGFYLVKLIK